MRMCALAAAAVTLTFTASAQTNAKHSSTVGTWKLDVAKSTYGSEAPPKSMTLTILKDTPQACSWRVDAVDEKGQAVLSRGAVRRTEACIPSRMPKVRRSGRRA